MFGGLLSWASPRATRAQSLRHLRCRSPTTVSPADRRVGQGHPESSSLPPSIGCGPPRVTCTLRGLRTRTPTGVGPSSLAPGFLSGARPPRAEQAEGCLPGAPCWFPTAAGIPCRSRVNQTLPIPRRLFDSRPPHVSAESRGQTRDAVSVFAAN